MVANCLRSAAVLTIKRLLCLIYPAHATKIRIFGPKMAKFDQKNGIFDQIGPNICLSGPIWCYV